MLLSRRHFSQWLSLSAAVPSVAMTNPMRATDQGGEDLIAINRVAILGCIRQNRPVPAFESYVKAGPDLSLWIGDNIYVDTQVSQLAFREAYQALSQKPFFSELRKTGIHMATWDDHDFGDNDENRHYILKDYSKSVFTDFWELGPWLAAPKDGVYNARDFEFKGKRLKVIMLDVRYNRDIPNSDGDILGQTQWLWLTAQLSQKADLILLISGSQILLDKECGSETWEHYPRARARLMALIRQTQTEHIVFITGDQHYAEVASDPGALDFDAIELQFCGLNQTEKPELNSYRISPVATALNKIGLIDIQWEDNKYEKAHLLFTVRDSDSGALQIAHRINFSDIGLSLRLTNDTVFDEMMQISVDHNYAHLEVRYTLDGQIPDGESDIYTTPIEVMQTTQVTAALFDCVHGFRRSKDFVRTYQKATSLRAVAVRAPQEGVGYAYYEGNFQSAAEIINSRNAPIRRGYCKNFDLSALELAADHFALSFDGFIHISTSGFYRLELQSDDGAILDVAKVRLINNDGSHSERVRSGFARFEQGYHPLSLYYFEDYSGQSLSLRLFLKQGQDWRECPLDLFHEG